jgi:signal transduction histidine kinase
MAWARKVYGSARSAPQRAATLRGRAPMKVVSKFAVVFFLASCLCLAVYSYVVARSEVARLEHNVSSDLTMLGRNLSDGMRAAWDEGGEQRAVRVLEAASGRSDEVAITWRPTIEPAGSSVKEKAGGRVVQVVVPLRRLDGSGGTILLERSVPSEGSILSAELVDELGFAASLAVIGAALAITLGGALIGRPLQRVVEQARRIGDGDFSQRLSEGRHDEIGELKRELNVMCEHLIEARRKLDDESTARLETLEQLRQLDRLRTVGTLASSIAHELGTPLNVLLLRGQSLVKEDLEPQELRDTGTAIVSQVDKMSRIVRELLDFARRQPAAQSDVDLGDVARHATRLLESIARKHGVKIQLEVSGPAPVKANFGHVEQAITNLIVNGIHAMSEGGTLRVEVTSEDKLASVSVSDEGAGISEEALPKIFEPFFTTKPAGQGTGLGLPVAKGIAEDHRGTISVTSEVGKGSTFKLTLPRAA